MKTRTPRQQIEALGAGVFIRDRNIESRLTEEGFHRAFSEPVILWIFPGEFQEHKMPEIFDAVRKFCSIQCFRFPNSEVSNAVLDSIRRDFPSARIEGVKNSKPIRSPQPTTYSFAPGQV